MKRTMVRTVLLAAGLVVGCGSESGGVPLEVQLLSVSGRVANQELEGSAYTSANGERSGGVGTFAVSGPGTLIQLSACPLGDLDVDPYGLGGEPSDRPFVDDGGVGSGDPGRIGNDGCSRRGLSVCDREGCVDFDLADVSLAIVEEAGWRRLAVDADGAIGEVHLELLYREAH